MVISKTAQKIKFSILEFSSKCDQICSILRIWSHLLKKSLSENFIFRAEEDIRRATNSDLKDLKSITLIVYGTLLKTARYHRAQYRVNVCLTFLFVIYLDLLKTQ